MKEDKIRLLHILDAIQEIEAYLDNQSFPTFIENSMMKFACVKQLEIIGEACNHISPQLQQQLQEIEWKQIIGMRNLFVHEYFGIDSNIVWDIIQNDIPDLKTKILSILDSPQISHQ